MNTTLKRVIVFISIAGIICLLQLQRQINPVNTVKLYLLQSINPNLQTTFQLNSSYLVSQKTTATKPGIGTLPNTDAGHFSSFHNNQNEIIMFTTFINAPGRLPLQRVVINNWSQHYPLIRCILFVNFTERNLSPDFEDLIKYSVQKNWTVFPITDVNDRGTPFLMPWFKLVILTFTAKLYGFVNGDNIFDDGLVDTLSVVIKLLPKLNDSVLVTGMRRNIVWMPGLNGSTLWKSPRIREVAKHSSAPVPYAEDYFFVGKQFPYQGFRHVVVGRSGVDNYLILRAKELDVVTIDASSTITDVHIQPSEGRVQGGEAVDRHFNYGVVGKVTWWNGNTDTTLMKTVTTSNGNVSIECRKSPCFINGVNLTTIAASGR